jgi:hypothetical protein
MDLKLLALSVVVFGLIFLLKPDQEKDELRLSPALLPSSNSFLTLATCHLYSFFPQVLFLCTLGLLLVLTEGRCVMNVVGERKWTT